MLYYDTSAQSKKEIGLWNKLRPGINCFTARKDFQAATYFRAIFGIRVNGRNLSSTHKPTGATDVALSYKEYSPVIG